MLIALSTQLFDIFSRILYGFGCKKFQSSSQIAAFSLLLFNHWPFSKGTRGLYTCEQSKLLVTFQREYSAISTSLRPGGCYWNN